MSDTLIIVVVVGISIFMVGCLALVGVAMFALRSGAEHRSRSALDQTRDTMNMMMRLFEKRDLPPEVATQAHVNERDREGARRAHIEEIAARANNIPSGRKPKSVSPRDFDSAVADASDAIPHE